jgi:hypothetical protein
VLHGSANHCRLWATCKHKQKIRHQQQQQQQQRSGNIAGAGQCCMAPLITTGWVSPAFTCNSIRQRLQQHQQRYSNIAGAGQCCMAPRIATGWVSPAFTCNSIRQRLQQHQQRYSNIAGAGQCCMAPRIATGFGPPAITIRRSIRQRLQQHSTGSRTGRPTAHAHGFHIYHTCTLTFSQQVLHHEKLKRRPLLTTSNLS